MASGIRSLTLTTTPPHSCYSPMNNMNGR